MAFDRSYALSYSQAGPTGITGVSNYYLPILSPASSSSSVMAVLWLLDSGGGTLPEVVAPDQVSWLVNASATTTTTGTTANTVPLGHLPGLLFVHIPDAAYTTVDPSDHSRCFVKSLAADGVTPTDSDGGLMDPALRSHLTGVRAVSVGHDHGNDWGCVVRFPAIDSDGGDGGADGGERALWLIYGRHSGYGGYGDWARGARVFVLNSMDTASSSAAAGPDGVAMRTYVRMEDLSVIDGGPI
jgi:hypothetical protein